jgi:energy-coupling factor transporter ATP-binding protein EcfA2
LGTDVCTILIAANGVGKSTELSCLSQGATDNLTILPKGRHVKATSFAFVRQAVDRLSISHRVSSLLETPLILGGLSIAKARRRVKDTLGRFGFEELYDRSLAGLSGGEDQIIHLLGGILLGGSGLIVDDPFGMLDSRRISEMQQVLELYSKGGNETDASRDVVLALPNSDAHLASQLAEGTRDSLTIQLPTPEGIQTALTDFTEALPSFAAANHSSDCILLDKVRLLLNDQRNLVDDLSCKLTPGKIHLLTGENGAGKSLLLRAIVGQLPKAARVSAGTITTGRSQHTSRQRSDYAEKAFIFVPQHCHRLLTTTDPWSVMTELASGVPTMLSEHSMRLLESGIIWEKRPVTEASVGQVRFVTHLLAAISAITRPNIEWLIVDEPDAYLDTFYQRALANIYTALVACGKGVLITSHRKHLYRDLGAFELEITAN